MGWLLVIGLRYTSGISAIAFNVYWRPAHALPLQVGIHFDSVGDLDVNEHGEDRRQPRPGASKAVASVIA
jgi:hypothetical protein